MNFFLDTGSNWESGTLNTVWATNTTANRVVGGASVASAVNNYWQVTGVQLEAGAVATPFEFEPIETTLNKSHRYYERYVYGDGGHFPQAPVNIDNANRVEIMVFYKQKRTQPTINVSSATHLSFESATAAGGQAGTGGFGALVGSGTRGANLFCNVTAWTVNVPAYGYFSNPSGWMDFSAEL